MKNMISLEIMDSEYKIGDEVFCEGDPEPFKVVMVIVNLTIECTEVAPLTIIDHTWKYSIQSELNKMNGIDERMLSKYLPKTFDDDDVLAIPGGGDIPF